MKKVLNLAGGTLGVAGIVILVCALLCLAPLIFLWAINTLAEAGGSSFYIPHGVFNYAVALVLICIFKST